ncbi:MAG: hypothetical protein EAX96_15780, partial [Candidatus Lokiarchaeota archaeon]|nr:hypothetical protein [Candidatus Lokiarchaeota archaeon]
EIITNTNGGSVAFYNGSHYLPMQFQNNKWNITLTLSSDVGLFNYRINATKAGTFEKEILLSVQTLNLAGDITSEVAGLNIEFTGNYNNTNLNFNKTYDPNLNITTDGYNITLTNLSLFNIRKSNKTLVSSTANNHYEINNNIYATELDLSSFENGYLNSLSFRMRAPYLGAAGIDELNITIYNSSWNGTHSKPDKIIFEKLQIDSGVIIYAPISDNYIWINYTLNDKELYLDMENTANKTFFVSFNGTNYLGVITPKWALNTGLSNRMDYQYSGGSWIDVAGDFTLNFSLFELVNVSDIDLKIEGTPVIYTSDYSGDWENASIRMPDNNGIVSYDVTYNKEFPTQTVRFDYNFSTQIQNKTIISETSFITNITSSNVEWNSTFYLNLPTSNVNGVVNIIYPNYWELMSVLLESVNYSDAHNSSLGSEMLLTINDVNNLQGNGQWIILFQNSKLVCEFDVWRKQNGDYENITSFEFIGNSEILKMNGSILNAGIGTGNVSVEIWPTDNFPNLLDAPSNALGEFETNDWQLQDYITDDGNCTILFVWTNDTYVTTAYKTILIYNSSRLETLDPDPPILIGENIIEAYDGYEFNITVNFTMYYYNGGSWITIPVPGTGIINYITNSDEISPTNGTLDHVENGKWTKNFTIPNTYSAEGYFIFLNATYPGIENITYNYTIRLVNRTSLEITHQDVPWNDNVTFTLNYTNNADGSGVDPADISIIYESVSPGESGNLIEGINFTVNNIGNGIYNITMNTSIFNAIIYNLTFTINGTSVQTQQKFQLLSVYNRSTSLSLITALPSIYLGNNITIQLQFNDFNKVKGIADASIGFNWTTIVWSWNESTTLGKYFIVIDSSNFNYRGLYSLKFNASLINYTTAEITVILNISKMFASLSAIQAQNGVLDNNVLNISYNQTAHLIVHYNISGSWPQSGNGITGASIIATLNGSSLFYSSITGQAGNYSISVDTSVIQNVITTLTDDMHNYDLLISIERDGYEAKILNLNVKILPLNTSCSRSDSQAQIKIFSNQQLTLSANIFDQFNQKIKSGQGTVFYIIHNQTGQKYSGILNWNAELDTFTNTSSWTDTGLHNGTYNITFNFTSSKDYFYDSSVDILNGLKVYAENETIVSVLTYQVPLTIIENQNIILKAFLKDNQDSLLEDRNINFTITAFFRDGTFERITLTNSTQIGTAMALVNYIIPQWAISIAISMNYYGEFSITPSSISTNIVVTQAIYSLKLQNIPSESRPGQSITYYANLTINGMPAVGYNITFILTFIHVGGDQTTYYKNVTTDSQGIAQFEYVSPATASAVSIYAIYYGGKGFSKDASPISIPLLTDSEIFLRQYGQLIQMIIIGLIICSVVIVVGILAYAKLIRPKRESLTDKKRKLMVQKSETNRELARITTEINQLRQKTINDAKIAKFENRFEDARKLYEKVGNLSLELAEKSVAKEFFSLAKEMAQKEEETKSRSQLIEERNKIIAKAREAIKNHKIDLANKHYQEVIAISRRLKDNDAVQRFSKLIGETTEKVESIKQVNIRKKLGDLLTQANDLMDNQKFSDAASYFEEASYILLTLNEMDGVERYAEWARAARMRSGILTGTGDEWTQQIENKMNMNIKNANELVQKDADEKAIKILYQSSIFALELENKSLFEKLLKEIEKIKEKEKVGAEEFISDDQIKLNNYLKMAKTSEDSGNINASLKYYDKALKTAKIMNDSDKINEISEKIDNLNQRLEKMAESLAKEIAEGDLKREEEIVDEEKDEAEITVKTLKPLPGVKPGSETEPTEPKIKIKTFTKPKIDEEHVGKQEVEKIIDAEISEAKIDVILKIASDSLNNKNYQTASYLYRKAADLSKDIDDMEQFTELNMKSEEIKLLKPSKIKSQRDLRTELAKLVNSIPKFKGPTEKLIKLYENIIETFLLVDEEDAANEYIQKYIDLIRKSD